MPLQGMRDPVSRSAPDIGAESSEPEPGVEKTDIEAGSDLRGQEKHREVEDSAGEAGKTEAASAQNYSHRSGDTVEIGMGVWRSAFGVRSCRWEDKRTG